MNLLFFFRKEEQEHFEHRIDAKIDTWPDLSPAGVRDRPHPAIRAPLAPRHLLSLAFVRFRLLSIAFARFR